MNEELQNALVEFVAMITSAAQTAAEFGAEQLPEVIEQLLAWSFWSHAAWAAFWVIASFVLATINFYVVKTRQKQVDNGGGFLWDRHGNPEGACILFWATILFGWIPFVCAIDYSMSALKIAIAPKVWLIEYAASLAK